MSQSFDRFMVQAGIGTNRKLRRLPVAHRWTYVAGVLALAAQSPMRGALLIADGEPVTADDVAAEASVTVRQARAALEALRALGMLERDEHGIEWVHDWDKMNPDPKPSDLPHATRARKRKERERRRQANGHADVTRDVTPASGDGHAPEEEGEVEEEELPLPLAPRPAAAGSSIGLFTSRSQALAVACPACFAPAAAPCHGQGGPREQCHQGRHAAAIDGGATALDFDPGTGRPRAPRPGLRAAGTNPRAAGTNLRARADSDYAAWAAARFPGEPVSKVKALQAHLRDRGIEPTAEAMIDYGREHPLWALTVAEGVVA